MWTWSTKNIVPLSRKQDSTTLHCCCFNSQALSMNCLLANCEVKMAGYIWTVSWLLGSILHVLRPRCIQGCKHANKKWGQYPAILNKKAWLMEVCFIAYRKPFSCWTQGFIEGVHHQIDQLWGQFGLAGLIKVFLIKKLHVLSSNSFACLWKPLPSCWKH